MSALAIKQVRADIAVLAASVDRAGQALGCVFSDSSEFERTVVAARRRDGAIVPSFQAARVVVAVTAASCTAMLVWLAV